MKRYPKVPRHDHPVVDDAFYESEAAWLTEKVDGSNFRFALFDDRYAETATWRTLEATDIQPPVRGGDIVFGTKTTLRGTTRTPVDDLDGNLRRAARALRAIDPDVNRCLHDEWGQLVFFAENMILSTIDHGYRDDPPPPLLGFDVYAPADDPRPPSDRNPSNPYDDTFDGFLPAAVVFGSPPSPGVFDRLGVPTTTVYERDVSLRAFDPESSESYEIPESAWAENVTAEGVVVRNESRGDRVKLVTEGFTELNRRRWGVPDPEADTETGTEEFVARFCTNARIRSVIRRMVVDEGYAFSRSIIDDLYLRVVDDIWAEEWRTIKALEIEFTPADVPPLVAKRCVEVVTMMETNSRLNDAPPEELWRDP